MDADKIQSEALRAKRAMEDALWSLREDVSEAVADLEQVQQHLLAGQVVQAYALLSEVILTLQPAFKHAP